MTENQFHLLKTKRFLPLFITFFLGAANDNFFRNAMVILILYRIADQTALDGKLLVTMAAGIFILPFFLLSALAGQLADKFEKSSLIRRIKIAEIAIMVFGAAGLVLGDAYFLLFVLFMMGTQSSFFGPVKYSILPLHLRNAPTKRSYQFEDGRTRVIAQIPVSSVVISKRKSRHAAATPFSAA